MATDNKGNLFNKPKNNKETQRDDTQLPKKEEENPVPDLDGDGMIGNTGGFYGGTSYVGSNYGEDWNKPADTGEGNYGAAGYKDRKEDEDEETNEDDMAH
jgi:hypothetical protein